MKTTEFCYWLQGYFELGGDTLTTKQISIVNAHLDLVFKYIQLTKAKPDAGSSFCYLLKGMLLAGNPDVPYIKSELNKCFLHEIDPTYGDQGVQNILNQAHSGDSPKITDMTDENGYHVIMRC